MTSNMDAFLRTMEYPCTVEDLLREGRREGLPTESLGRLRELADRRFSGARDVLGAGSPV